MLGALSSHVFLGMRQRRLCRKGAAILTYHYLGDPPEGRCDPFLYVSSRRFEEQLMRLRAAGLPSVSLDALAGSSGPCSQGVAITFDDGAVNVFKHALGALARYGVTATQFIVAGNIGGHNEWDTKHGSAVEPLMDASQIREWLAAGQQIGSHSLTHRNLTRCSRSEAREQIIASKKLLEDLFSVPVRHFCYPHGRWTREVRDIVEEAGYETACTTQHGVNAPEADRFALRRITPLSARELLLKAAHRARRRFG